MGGIVIAEYQVAFHILIVIGIGELFQAVASIYILIKKKLGAIKKSNISSYDTYFRGSGVRIQF